MVPRHNQFLLLEINFTVSHYQTTHTYVPVAEPSVLVICTVRLVDDGLLRTSAACAGSSSSLTLYLDWPNITVMAR